MKKTSLKSIIVLIAISLFIAAAMAAVNLVTAPRIAEAKRQAQQEALSAVLPENGGFEELAAGEGAAPESVTAIYRDNDGEGYVALLSVKGYDSSKPMELAVGFTSGGAITEIKVISAQGETSGIGSKVTDESFLSQFEGKTKADIGEVDTISGATISSSAFVDAVKEVTALIGADGR